MVFGAKKKEAAGKKSSGGFKYKARTKEDYEKRATAGSGREGFVVEGVNMFSPKAGSHSIRILPPTWDDAEHYGFDAYAHYDIGPDNGSYLCLDRMKGESCPICEERQRAVAAGEEELMEKLKWRRRVLCWVIDRDNESDGPLLWSMPQSLDKEISSVCQDKKTQEVYSPDDPSENGYDVSFEREGEKLKTKYVGVVIDRKPSPLSEDEDTAAEWLEFITENPIPDQLVFQDGEYIAGLVEGGMAVAAKARKKAKKGDDDTKKEEEDGDDDDNGSDMTWEEVHELSEDDLEALAEKHEVDVSDADDAEQAADMVCEALEIEKPKKKSAPAKGKFVPKKKVKEEDVEEEKPTRLAQLRKKNKG